MKKVFISNVICYLVIALFFPSKTFAATQITKANVVSSSLQSIDKEKGFISHGNGTKEEIDHKYKSLFINGSLIYKPNIITENNRTLVPVRLVSENLGASVSWDDKTKTVTIKNNTTTIQLVINKQNAVVNNKNINLDVAPKIYNNYTYLPLRFVSENLNCDVGYYDPNIDPETKGILAGIPTVFIDSKDINSTVITKEEAKKNAAEKCSKAYENFKKDFKHGLKENEASERFNLIKNSIDNITYIGSISRYYRFSGPYDILFDKYTGDMYFVQNGYITIVSEININDKEIFISGYFAG